METNADFQNLIDEYVKQVNGKEDDLVGLRRNIDGIISVSKQELKNVTASLDRKFNDNKISEKEYLAEFRAEKENILERTKEKLSSLIDSYDKMYSALNL